MGFLKNIFKRKPGGTLVGNILRGTIKAATGLVPGVGGQLSEIVGTQLNTISQEEYDIKNLSDADYQAKYGITKTGAAVPGVSAQPGIGTVEQRIEQLRNAANPGILQTIKNKYLVPVIAAGVGVVALIIYLIKRKK